MEFKRLLGVTPTPMLHTYRGFGSHEEVVIVGRVTETQFRTKTTSSNSLLHALRFTRSYLASPRSQVLVTATFGGQTASVRTDETGIFEIHIEQPDLNRASGSAWFKATVSLPEYPDTPIKKAPVLVEGRDNAFGIITDVDDTVLISNATKKLKLLYATIFQSPDRRLPFPGVSEFYNALVTGIDGNKSNPIFYVSSSHFNLFAFLKRFFNLNKLPKGPLLLKRTAGLSSLLTTVGKHNQKYEDIVMVLKAYPRLPFVLLGDSGQHDAKIYSEIIEEFPDRIKAVYIRDITTGEDALVEKAMAKVAGKVPFIAAKNSLAMAQHAARIKLIPTASVKKVGTAI